MKWWSLWKSSEYTDNQPPQSASIVSRPMVVDGNIVPRSVMYIALSYDH
ncbi:unnamed protein product [Musa acuminata subsp. burmannicoides]